jgi:N,N'-diacetyllegionaminate synthase
MSTKIILDACLNHNGDIRNVNQMILKAKESGADYIKFQMVNSKELNKNWDNYYENLKYYEENELSRYMYYDIIEKCKSVGINCLFTVFSLDSAKKLLDMNQKEVKIASPDADNWELVLFCVLNFERVFVSTGMIDTRNLIRLKQLLRPRDVLFYCISKYPTKPSDIDYDKMALYDGFSDHTETIESAKKAIDLGLQWVERHFTLGKFLPGRDHKLSSTPDEVKELCDHRDYVAKCEAYKRRWTNE